MYELRSRSIYIYKTEDIRPETIDQGGQSCFESEVFGLKSLV